MPFLSKKQRKGRAFLILVLLAALALTSCQYDLSRTQPELVPNLASQEEGSEPRQESMALPADEEFLRFTEEAMSQVSEEVRSIFPDTVNEIRVELEQSLLLSGRDGGQSRLLLRYSVSAYQPDASGELSGGVRFFATADAEIQGREILNPEYQIWEKNPQEIESYFQSLYGETHPVRLEIDLPVQ